MNVLASPQGATSLCTRLDASVVSVEWVSQRVRTSRRGLECTALLVLLRVAASAIFVRFNKSFGFAARIYAHMYLCKHMIII